MYKRKTEIFLFTIYTQIAKIKKQKTASRVTESHTKTPLYLSISLFAFNFDNFLAAVISASLANAVIQNEFSALGALGHSRQIKLPCA